MPAHQSWAVSHGAIKNPIANILAGRVTLADTGTRQLDYDSDYWDLSQAATESQHMMLHSLRWLDPLLKEALDAEDPAAYPHLPLLESQIASWRTWSAASKAAPGQAWLGHPTALRTSFLVGAGPVFGDRDWYEPLLREHLDYLIQEDNFSGFWNHGLAEALALYAVGQHLGHDEATATGRDRIHGCIDEMVDQEGAINEQATQYAGYVLNLMVVCQRAFAANQDLPSLELAQAREAALQDFIRHATTPRGTYELIGDSFEGPVPSHMQREFNRGGGLPEPNFGAHGRLAIYERGYVFARSGWGEERERAEEDFLSARFGPGRIIHGHNDHFSLTWYTAGRPVLVDSGHTGYAKGPYRSHLQSIQAHNLVEVVGQRHDWAAQTTLEWVGHQDQQLRFELTDRAFAHVQRTRIVNFIPRKPLLVVDRLRSVRPKSYRQLWHIAPQFSELVELGALARVRDPQAGLDAVLLPVCSGEAEPPLIDHWYGAEEPCQGWFSNAEGAREPAHAFGVNRSGGNVDFVTALVVVPAGAEVRHRYKKRWFREAELEIHWADQLTSYRFDGAGRPELVSGH